MTKTRFDAEYYRQCLGLASGHSTAFDGCGTVFDNIRRRRFSVPMPYRTFADDEGRSWEVWDVRAHPLSEGWLVFRSDDEKRRFAPIPANWDSCRGQELRDLLVEADVIVGRLDEKSA